MLNKGWIKIQRNIQDQEVWQNPNYLKVYLYVLLNANTKDKEVYYRKKKIDIRSGSFITSFSRMEKELGMPRSSIHRALAYLEAEQLVEQANTTRYSVLAIKQFKDHLVVKQEAERKSSNKRKVDQTDYNEIADKFSIDPSEVKAIHERIVDYEKSKGKRYKDMKATIRNWVRNDLQSGKLKQQEVIWL